MHLPMSTKPYKGGSVSLIGGSLTPKLSIVTTSPIVTITEIQLGSVGEISRQKKKRPLKKSHRGVELPRPMQTVQTHQDFRLVPSCQQQQQSGSKIDIFK
jgi:hypothetical protein